jgi:hypothetical protein
MKNLPLGKQNFEEIIREDLLYVDKTEQVYNLVQKKNLYFLSRPRRFGKSLLISTFRHLFEGKKYSIKKIKKTHNQYHLIMRFCIFRLTSKEVKYQSDRF